MSTSWRHLYVFKSGVSSSIPNHSNFEVRLAIDSMSNITGTTTETGFYHLLQPPPPPNILARISGVILENGVPGTRVLSARLEFSDESPTPRDYDYEGYGFTYFDGSDQRLLLLLLHRDTRQPFVVRLIQRL